MTHELKQLRQLLQQTPKLKANPHAKKAAISLALAEFDKNKLEKAQGNKIDLRLMVNTILRRDTMKTYQIAILGTVTVLLLVVAITPIQQTSLLEQVQMAFTASEPISVVQNEGRVSAAKPQEADRVRAIKEESLAKLDDEKEIMPEPAKPAQMATTTTTPSVNSPVTTGGIAPIMPPNKTAVLSSEKKQKTAAPKPYSASAQIAADRQAMPYYQDQGRDKFQEIKVNPLKIAKDEPVSTFSIDVDTASYSFVRASLNQNVLPQKDAVRVEELINYFPYHYQMPTSTEEPFKANVSVMPTPWNKDTKLMHIGIKGYQLDAKAKPQANLVFLIDSSGSMNEPNKLPLVQNSLKMLLDNLNENDSVAIVTYAGGAGVALEPTKVKDKAKINAVIDGLGAQGSTAGAEGIRQAYQLAEQNLNKDGINRVILATDGDFNVGITDQNELKSFIERKRATGVTLSVLGFGMGNYNDALMQTLAQNGNGNAAYIDTLNEARKALVEEAGSTLFTIAKDVKIQVEFNPEQVAEYRLIGYESRLLNREDFNNDKVDAGDIGAGHSVTALYEITPVNSAGKLVDDLRYQKASDKKDDKNSEYAFVKIRYKLPNSDTSKLLTTPVNGQMEYKTLEASPAESRFATSVAAFGQLLRGDAYMKDFNYEQVINLAEGAKGEDKFGYRAEFINLVRLAKNAPALPVLH